MISNYHEFYSLYYGLRVGSKTNTLKLKSSQNKYWFIIKKHTNWYRNGTKLFYSGKNNQNTTIWAMFWHKVDIEKVLPGNVEICSLHVSVDKKHYPIDISVISSLLRTITKGLSPHESWLSKLEMSYGALFVKKLYRTVLATQIVKSVRFSYTCAYSAKLVHI